MLESRSQLCLDRRIQVWISEHRLHSSKGQLHSPLHDRLHRLSTNIACPYGRVSIYIVVDLSSNYPYDPSVADRLPAGVLIRDIRLHFLIDERLPMLVLWIVFVSQSLMR